MSLFTDRTAAGEQLAALLNDKNISNLVVLAIPSGGVPVAIPFASSRKLPIYLCMVAKYFEDYLTGLGFGATDGRQIDLRNNDVIAWFGQSGLESYFTLEKLSENYATFGDFANLPNLDGKSVLIIDDAVATGCTTLAATMVVERFNPAQIIVAVPIATGYGREVLERSGCIIYSLQEITEPAAQPSASYDDFRHLYADDQAVLLTRYFASIGAQPIQCSWRVAANQADIEVIQRRANQATKEHLAEFGHWDYQKELPDEHYRFRKLMVARFGLLLSLVDKIDAQYCKEVYLVLASIGQLPVGQRSRISDQLIQEIREGKYHHDPGS